MSDAIVIQPDDDDLSKPPADLNDYKAWLDRGQLGLAMEGLVNKVTGIIGNEQTSQMLLKQLRKEQADRDTRLADTLEQALFGLKTGLDRRFADYEEHTDARLDAYGKEVDALRTLVEVRTAPFSGIADHLELIDDRLDNVEKALGVGPNSEWKRLEGIQDADREAAHAEITSLDRALARQLRLWALVIVVMTTLITTGISIVIHRILYDAIR